LSENDDIAVWQQEPQVSNTGDESAGSIGSYGYRDGFGEETEIVEERLRPSKAMGSPGIKNCGMTYQVLPNGH
jgi:hypothetical protein